MASCALTAMGSVIGPRSESARRGCCACLGVTLLTSRHREMGTLQERVEEYERLLDQLLLGTRDSKDRLAIQKALRKAGTALSVRAHSLLTLR